jgi:hypothetical protein
VNVVDLRLRRVIGVTSPPEQSRSALAEALELVRRTRLRSHASLRDAYPGFVER